MHIAFFGSSLVSAWWNGAATYYRGLLRALAARGHRITFYEPDAYDRQAHRDLPDPDWAEAAGAQWPLDLAGALTRVRGKLVIAGYHQGARQIDMQLWNWRGLDVINAHERDPAVYLAGIRGAITAIEAGVFDPTRLYSHHLPLEAIGEALTLTRDRPEGFVKALIRHD